MANDEPAALIDMVVLATLKLLTKSMDMMEEGKNMELAHNMYWSGIQGFAVIYTCYKNAADSMKAGTPIDQLGDLLRKSPKA